MAGALIGALRVSLSAETSAFEAGMKRSQRTAQTTANSIKSSFGSVRGEIGLLKSALAGFVGALSVGAVLAAGKAALDYAGSLGEVSQQLGVTARDLQVFRYAAGQTGVSQEQLETGLSKLTITLGRVAAGAEAPRKALAAIGVTAEQLRGLDTGEAFRVIADGLEKVTDRSQRAAVEVALFGRSGAQLDNLLAGGSKQVNELAAAAEELGIVLSDRQIQQADDTADKLEALQTVIKARIAGAVADNADSILQLADAIAEVANEAAKAIGWLSRFYAAAKRAGQQAIIDSTSAIDNSFFGLGKYLPGAANRAANRKAAQNAIAAMDRQAGAARFSALFRGRPKAAGPGADIGNFLAGGGGGGRRPRRSSVDRSAEEAERKRLEALRDANRFDQDIRRAKISVLQSEQQLAADYTERATIAVQILDAERAAFVAQQEYEVAAGEMTQVQADQLLAEYDRKDALERRQIIEDERQRAFEDSARLDGVTLELQRDALQSELQNADTAKEQRDLQLRLLKISYDIERQRLQTVLADKQSSEAAKEEARRRLAVLDGMEANDRQGVIKNTRGPLEDLFSQLPMDSDKLNEALEGVAANGLKSLEDGLLAVITGTKSVKEAFHDMAAQILAELLRIAIQKYIIGTIMKVAGLGMADGGEVQGYAYGGFVSGPGGPRSDSVPAMLSNGEFVINAKSTKKFLPILEAMNSGKLSRLAMGGLAIPRASFGQRAKFTNDNAGMAGMPPIVMHNDFRGADPSSVAAIQARQDRMEAELPARVVAAYRNAKDRFVIRD